METTDEKGFPFCRADFFLQFRQGESILCLTFLKAVGDRMEPLVDMKKYQGQRCLVECRAVGIYMGMEAGNIKLDLGHAAILVSPLLVRGAKRVELETLARVLDRVAKMSESFRETETTYPPDAAGVVVSVVNEIRQLIEENAIFLPQFRVADGAP